MAASNTERAGEREDRKRRGGKNRDFFMVNLYIWYKHSNRLENIEGQ